MKRILFICVILAIFTFSAYPQDTYDNVPEDVYNYSPQNMYNNTGQQTIKTGNLTVVVTGLRNPKGRAQVALFNSDKGFPLDPEHAYKTQTANITNGQAIARFNNVPFGEYALCAIHDEDMDGDFDRNWLFLPGEGWGTSNDAGGFFGPGSYKDSKFTLNSQTGLINIVIHY